MAETQPKPWKVETPHIADCRAGNAPFQTLVEPAHTLFLNHAANSTPKRRGQHYLYVRVRCNDTRCTSTAVFHLGTALHSIGLNDER